MELQLQSWSTVAVGLLTAGVILFLRYLRRNDDYWEKRGVPYVPRYSLLYGIWVLYTKPLHELLMEGYFKYPRVCGRFELSTPAVTVAEPDLVKDILVKDFHIFSSRRVFGIDDAIMSKMVSVLNGEDWKRIRTIITPAFTSRKMRKMTHIINSCSETVLQNLKGYYEKGISIDCRKIFGAFTMDVIASSAFATKIDSLNDPNNPFVVNARNSLTLGSIVRGLLFMIVPQKVWQILGTHPFDVSKMQFFKSATLQVIEERREKGQKGNDFLQMLLDASEEVIEGERKVAGFQTIDATDEEDHFGRIDVDSNITYTTKKMTQDELIAQCVLFFIVGYATSASTLSFLAYNLAINSDCQEKLIQEIDEIFEKKDEISYEDVRDMKYLDSCLSESLRLFPPLIMTERTASEDYVLGNTGITVTKDMIVGLPIYAMHHDPEFYPDPEKFEPERFMGDNRQNRNPYTYLPFGAGPRNCLGMRFAIMEIKLVLSNILRQYRFRPAPETKIPLQITFSDGLLGVKELPLLVEKRSDVKKKLLFDEKR